MADGNPTRAFSAGLDTTQSFGQPDIVWNHLDPGEYLSPKWQKLWKPVVCAVQGMCTAGAFYFVNESGARAAVRWSLAPIGQAPHPLPRSGGPNTLFDDLIRQIGSGPQQWKLLVTLAAPTDPVNDATVAWPAQRRVIETGTVTLTSVETERAGNARDINFDPMVLPDGIEPSDDPLLSARSAVYAASFRLRAGEHKSASAVNVGAVTL